jgi:hypothetical protein
MAKETTKREARWNNDGGAPAPLNRGASGLRSDDAVEFGVHPSWGGGDKRIPMIAARAVEFKKRRGTAVQRDIVHWPVAKIEADDRVGLHRKQQSENGIAVTAARTSDPSENERSRTALCAVAQDNRTAGASYDLLRYA